MLKQKFTFKDFTESEENIVTNILSDRLKNKSFKGLSLRKNYTKKNKLYILTDKGLSLIPMIEELTLWGDENLRDLNPIHV